MFAVVGSGFGLYGYVPALVRTFEQPVILPEAYRAKAEGRAELRPYLASIQWAADIPDAIARATGVVLATVPAEQPALVARCCEAPRIDRIILEKPVATTPNEADDVLDMLDRSGKRYRIGYTLLHASFNRSLRWPAEAVAAIDWTFTAHHFAHDLSNWKRDPAQGGGVIRFFGVHVLALLANYGYDTVVSSRIAGETERWQAELTGPARRIAKVRVDSRVSPDRFRIGFDDAAAVDIAEPFALERPRAKDDRRVPVLERLLASFRQDDGRCRQLYRATHALWRGAESAA